MSELVIKLDDRADDLSRKTFAPNALPKKINKKLYVHYVLGGLCGNPGEIRIESHSYENMDSMQSVIITEFEVEVELPENIDVKGKYLAVLTDQMSNLKRRHKYELRQVQDKIDALLAIEGPKQ